MMASEYLEHVRQHIGKSEWMARQVPSVVRQRAEMIRGCGNSPLAYRFLVANGCVESVKRWFTMVESLESEEDPTLRLPACPSKKAEMRIAAAEAREDLVRVNAEVDAYLKLRGVLAFVKSGEWRSAPKR